MFVAGPHGGDKKIVLTMQLALGKGDVAFVMARRQPGRDHTTNGRAMAAQEAE